LEPFRLAVSPWPVSTRLSDRLLRSLFTAGHKLLKLVWFVRRPRTFGAHALALTRERKVILVRLRYARGWRLPGGGRSEDEDPRDAVLRELREEIGMTEHGRVRRSCDLEEKIDFKRDLASLLIVEDVSYRPPRWSWEVEQIIERPLDDLPTDMASVAANWINAVRDRL
jgi:8-oxo-dGTP pyrophosphatase MutT (NUDIX family)